MTPQGWASCEPLHTVYLGLKAHWCYCQSQKMWLHWLSWSPCALEAADDPTELILGFPLAILLRPSWFSPMSGMFCDLTCFSFLFLTLALVEHIFCFLRENVWRLCTSENVFMSPFYMANLFQVEIQFSFSILKSLIPSLLVSGI